VLQQGQHWVADALVYVIPPRVAGDGWAQCSDADLNVGQWSMEVAYDVNQNGIDGVRASEELDDPQTASICFYGYALI